MRQLLLIVALSAGACVQLDPSGQVQMHLQALLAAPKFEPHDFYAGVDTPEDKNPLTRVVDDAIRDLIAMPEPRDAAKVRQRLDSIIEGVDGFATEDRERAYMYAVMAWRAAGFTTESGLLPVSDQQVLQEP